MIRFVSSLLQPSAHIEKIQDPKKVDEMYRYWRVRTFYSIYIGYVIFYFTRKSFTFAMPLMIDDLGFSMADLGFLGSVLYITYGISKFLSGILSDRSNPRYFMAIGLILTGITNIFFGMSSSVMMFALFWAINGIFQGWGWPPCTKQLTYWFSTKERGLVWSLKSTSHNVGGAIIPLLVAGVSTWAGWRYSLYVPGGIAILGGFWLIERMRDVPESMGLPCVEQYKGGAKAPNTKDEAPKTLSAKQILFDHVLVNRSVWILALSYFMVYVVRTGINDWGALYLVKCKGYSLVGAAASISWFEVGGFLGILAGGWASDKYFGGRRVPYMLLCSLGLIATIWGFWATPSNQVVLDSLLMALLGFLIFGPQLLVGLAAAEFVDKKAACTANGFAGCFAYIGAAFTGYPLGTIIDRWGWDGFFAVILICSFATFVILLPLVASRMRHHQDDPEPLPA